MTGDSGIDLLNAARYELNNLRASEDAVVSQTLALVGDDAVLVLEGLSLHVAAVRLLAETAEPTDPYAAMLILLALQGDLLRSGWTSALRGYYAAALTQLRVIRELSDYAMAGSPAT